MDPNAALDNIRRIIGIVVKGDESDGADLGNLAQEALEDMAALDEWIAGGGFLPADWDQEAKNFGA